MVLYHLLVQHHHGTAGFCFLLFFPFLGEGFESNNVNVSSGARATEPRLGAPDREWGVPKSGRRSRRDPNPDGPETTCIKSERKRTSNIFRARAQGGAASGGHRLAAHPHRLCQLPIRRCGSGSGSGSGSGYGAWAGAGAGAGASFHRVDCTPRCFTPHAFGGQKRLQRGQSAMRIRGAKKRAAKSAWEGGEARGAGRCGSHSAPARPRGGPGGREASPGGLLRQIAAAGWWWRGGERHGGCRLAARGLRADAGDGERPRWAQWREDRREERQGLVGGLVGAARGAQGVELERDAR